MVQCPTENACVLDRDLVGRLLWEPGQLATVSSTGIKLYGIRRDSFTAAIGLHNGDMITHIDDTATTTLDRAMAASMKARHASSFSLTLIRAGETITKRLELR